VSLRRWTAARALALALIAITWVVAGIGTYLFLSSHRSTIAGQAKLPGEGGADANGPLKSLPGTMYLVQDGTLYRLRNGTFTALLRTAGSASWTQPAVSPDGQRLVVVRRDHAYSDLYLVDSAGHVQSQLTHNANKTIELNHWAMYPRLAADGTTLFFSYDPKDRFNSFNVVLAVWSLPLGGSTNQMRKWTLPQGYTGGDLQPVPLPNGGVLYTKYSLDPTANKILSQIYLTTRSGTVGQPLTPAADDCSQPSLSPDGQRLAMICTRGTQMANVEVAAFDGTNVGPRRVVVAGQLAAQPTWAPDSNGLVYLAAQGVTGHFQLWLQQLAQRQPPPSAATMPVAAAARRARTAAATPTPTPSPTVPTPTPTPLPAPVRLTTNLNFDATSTIAWHA
jgi:WD40-like Beta Propeller Repeat